MPIWEQLQTMHFWTALGSIILIDIVLAGDNAIVIALAARRLPADLQRRAIMLGTAGAIIVRVALTLVAVSLLRYPGLMLVGGLLLLWIAYKLLVQEDGEHTGPEATTLRQALQTIIIADTVMGLDNIIAIAGAAHDSFFLVLLGLIISIPLVVWGSTLVMRMLTRFPILVFVGAAVLVMTAVQMVLRDPLIHHRWDLPMWLPWLLHICTLITVLGLGYRRRKNLN